MSVTLHPHENRGDKQLAKRMERSNPRRARLKGGVCFPAKLADSRGATAPASLHRFSPFPEEGDLTLHDLVILWGVMQAENLADVFFHDGSVASLPEFIRYASDPGVWFYAVKHGGIFIGFGVVNGFSSSGNTAFVHLCSFEAGRKAGDSANSPFAEAGRQWFGLLRNAGGLDTVIAVFPACYRSVRQWVKIFDFVERMRLPGALRLARKSGVRITDALVCEKRL